ncbi:MAG: hypothetical protein KTR25_05250 [Myxococcales bacterium]|nr:hypothetical protein [Myxococcales bacterium]
MYISSTFESGNIEVIDATSCDNIRLRIRKDVGENHFQWFYFRVTEAEAKPLTLHIENAGEASFPRGWEQYRACWSVNRRDWKRVDTQYDGRILTIRLTPSSSSVWLAYFAPYTYECHADLITRSIAQGAGYERLTTSVQGRDVDLLRVGNPQAIPMWIIARQHPGESMAQWLMDGLLSRLLDVHDPVTSELRERACWFLVPNMNPDGTVLGHLRNNAAGANLNREWLEATPQRSPEVYYVRERMKTTGVKFFLDVHGDEALPYNFIAGAEGIPSWTELHAVRQDRYLAALRSASPDFQTVHGYPRTPPGTADLTMATNWVGEHFGCLSMTLEQPFKDTANRPHVDGWSPDRAKRLGEAVLSAIWSSWDSIA